MADYIFSKRIGDPVSDIGTTKIRDGNFVVPTLLLQMVRERLKELREYLTPEGMYTPQELIGHEEWDLLNRIERRLVVLCLLEIGGERGGNLYMPDMWGTCFALRND